MAENIETKIPIKSVTANPLTIPDPNQIKIIEVIIVEKFESRIDDHARRKPS